VFKTLGKKNPVRTKQEEKKWDEAKKIVAKSRGYGPNNFKPLDWGLVNTIFQRKKDKMGNPKKIERHLLLDENRGIHIPKKFIQNFEPKDWNVNKSYAKILLEGPDNDRYWDVWDVVLREAIHTDKNGVKWTLEQDGDLWAIPEGYYDEEEESEEECEERTEPDEDDSEKEQNPREYKSSTTYEERANDYLTDLKRKNLEVFEQLAKYVMQNDIRPREKSRIHKKIKILEKVKQMIVKAEEIGQ
jgi:hypothetical protein